MVRGDSWVEDLRRSLHAEFPEPIRVVLAVSGGADSVSLLRGWIDARQPIVDHLVVASFDHQLRPNSSEDVAFVGDLARSLGLAFETGLPTAPIDSGSGRSLEGAAREARYHFLANVARQHEAQWVATAHTADDQVETVLHRIMRGTGLRGLAGIPRRRSMGDGIELIRPMLRYWRRDLEDYLGAIQQSFRIDPTNEEARFTRNRLRHQLLPLLRSSFNPSVDEAVYRLAEIARAAVADEGRWIEQSLQLLIRRSDPLNVTLDSRVLSEMSYYRACTLVRAVIERQGWPLRPIGMQHLTKVVELSQSDRPRALQLPGSIQAKYNPSETAIEMSRSEAPAAR